MAKNDFFVVKGYSPISGLPVEIDLTSEDLPTFGAPATTTDGIVISKSGIVLAFLVTRIKYLISPLAFLLKMQISHKQIA